MRIAAFRAAARPAGRRLAAGAAVGASAPGPAPACAAAACPSAAPARPPRPRPRRAPDVPAPQRRSRRRRPARLPRRPRARDGRQVDPPLAASRRARGRGAQAPSARTMAWPPPAHSGSPRASRPPGPRDGVARSTSSWVMWPSGPVPAIEVEVNAELVGQVPHRRGGHAGACGGVARGGRLRPLPATADSAPRVTRRRQATPSPDRLLLRDPRHLPRRRPDRSSPAACRPAPGRPVPMRISSTTPSSNASISIAAFAVSTTATIWPRFTGSPGSTNHSTIVPTSMSAPSEGIRNSPMAQASPRIARRAAATIAVDARQRGELEVPGVGHRDLRAAHPPDGCIELVERAAR